MKIGTKIWITDPHSHYYGRIGWIEGDNQIVVAFAIEINSPVIPPLHYHYYVIAPDNQDIEHGWTELGGFEVVRQ